MLWLDMILSRQNIESKGVADKILKGLKLTFVVTR